jgi:hypothetical protein
LFTDRHGFVTGDTVVWPSAPALPGITMRLVRAGLRRHGVAFEDRPDLRAVLLAAYDSNSWDEI